MEGEGGKQVGESLGAVGSWSRWRVEETLAERVIQFNLLV